MPAQSKTSTVETALTVLREAAGPMTFDKLMAAVNAVAPIRTRDPVATLRGAIHNTRLIQRTGDGRYGYIPALATGSVLRHVLTDSDLRHHRLVIDKDVQTAVWPAGFEIQKRADKGPRTFILPDGREFSASLEFFGPYQWGMAFPDWVGQWLKGQKAAAGDALIVRVVDCAGGTIHLEFEPRTARDEARIMVRNATLAGTAHVIVQSSQSVVLLTEDLALRLLARGAYQDPMPPDPLKAVLSQNPLLQVGDLDVTLRGRREPLNLPRWMAPAPPTAPGPLSRAEIGQLMAQGRLDEAFQAMLDSGLISEREGEVTIDLRGLFGPEPPPEEFDRGWPERGSGRGRRRTRRQRKELAQQVYRFKASCRARGPLGGGGGLLRKPMVPLTSAGE